MAILKQDVFKTITDLDELKKVLHWFDTFQGPPIPQTVWLQCQLALIEGFTNAVRHAHADLPQATPISIEVIVTDEYIEIRIWDQGPGFDLDALLSQKLKRVNLSEPGGRGLVIIYKVADELGYHAAGKHRNCLYIRKYRA